MSPRHDHRAAAPLGTRIRMGSSVPHANLAGPQPPATTSRSPQLLSPRRPSRNCGLLVMCIRVRSSSIINVYVQGQASVGHHAGRRLPGQ